MIVKFLIDKINNKVLQSSFIYTFASVVNASIPFLLIPFLTKYLSTEQFGVVSTFMVVNSVFVLLIGLEQQSFLSVNFFSDPVKSKDIVSNILLLSLVNLVFFFGITVVFMKELSEFFELNRFWILISIGVGFNQFIAQVILTLWLLQGKPMKYGLFQILNSLLNYSISIVLIMGFGLNEEGRILGIALSSVIFGIIGFFLIKKSGYFSFTWNKETIKRSLIFSLPLVPHALAGWINSGLDRILINNYLGLGATGVYSVGYQLGMVVSIVASSFNRAFAPFIFTRLTNGGLEDKKLLIKYTYFYYVLLILFSICLYMIYPFIIGIFIDERYQGSEQYLGWIMLGFTADGLYYGVINYIYFSKKTHLVSLITFSSCIVHFLITFALLSLHGALAAAYSTAVTYMFSFVFAFLLAYKVFPMPWFFFLKKKGKE